MGVGDGWGTVAPPTVVPSDLEREEHWGHFDDVSFGFVATAALISMFLVMAIFERFLTPSSSLPSSSGGTSRSEHHSSDLEAQQVFFQGKLAYPSPKMTIYAKGVSVLMPGEANPTFLAHPAPVPCPPEPMVRPFHQHSLSLSLSPFDASTSS